MLLITDPIFCDPWEDSVLPVVELSESTPKPFKIDNKHVYLIGDYIYKVKINASLKDVKPGYIVQIGERFMVEPHSEATKESYHKKYIQSKEEYDTRMNSSFSFEEMSENYRDNYLKGNNIIRSGNIKITPIGEIYMPTLESDDDPLEKIIKLMLRHMKPVLNEYRESFDKKHGLDNIKSALNGATKNMSILKFMSWCKNFDLDWEITIDNIDVDVPNPMGTMIVLNNRDEYPWEDIPEETKDCFTVPCNVGEDPLKRGIKLALGQKLIDLKDYRAKSPTQHLINNMKSALKSKQKMTLPYFINWCEIIDLEFTFKVVNKEDGVWYKMTGYNMTTNDKNLN